MRALVVIPTYNEIENIPVLIQRVLSTCPQSVDILVVDDGSPDGTGACVEALSQKDQRIHVAHRARKLGLGTAYVHGFRWGLERGYDVLIEMDADFSHDPAYLPTMLKELESKDVVIGSRYVAGGGTRNWGLGRKLLSRGGSLYSRLILGAPIRDFTGGFNGWRRRVLEAIDLASLKSDGYSFQIELKYRAFLKKFSIQEFPILFVDRKVGNSKMNRRIVFEALARVWQFRMKARRVAAIFGVVTALGGISQAAPNAEKTTAIFVDKKTNTLRVTTSLPNGGFEVVKVYHATLGKVQGDKVDEGDLKTPEGIYTFTNRLVPPQLKPKFGNLAFHMNFPNPFDRLASNTGSNIMLHATNEPDRLKNDYDSLGCVVVRNEEIQEIQNYIRIGLTPILIFPELKESDLKPEQDQRLEKFFDSWIKSWKTKDIENYISLYHTDFSSDGKSKPAWKAYKQELNKRYSEIRIEAETVRYYRHPKYSMVTFTQNYHSTMKNGQPGHRSRGTKILYVAEEAHQPKIIAESYTTSVW